MTQTRRQFLATTAAASVTPALPLSAQTPKPDYVVEAFKGMDAHARRLFAAGRMTRDEYRFQQETTHDAWRNYLACG